MIKKTDHVKTIELEIHISYFCLVAIIICNIYPSTHYPKEKNAAQLFLFFIIKT